jgi:hypothetical protein
MDWESFEKTLDAKLSNIPAVDTTHMLDTTAKLDTFVESVTTAIQDTICLDVPLCAPSSYKK